MTLQAVVLDMDGTINTSSPYYAAYEAACLSYVAEKLKISREEAEKLVSETRKAIGGMVATIEHLGIHRREFHDEMARRLKISSLMRVEPRLLMLIQHLKSSSLKVGLLSNSGRLLVLKILETMGCPVDAFDTVVTSDETELKPSKEPYLYIAQRLGVDPRDILYVGDRVSMELKPAKELGMKTVLVKAVGDHPRDPHVDWVIRSIYHLPGVVETVRGRIPKL